MQYDQPYGEFLKAEKRPSYNAKIGERKVVESDSEKEHVMNYRERMDLASSTT